MKDKVSIRPVLPSSIIHDKMTSVELFQNNSIRPILKMQHELLVKLGRRYIKRKKNAFTHLTDKGKEDYLAQRNDSIRCFL